MNGGGRGTLYIYMAYEEKRILLSLFIKKVEVLYDCTFDRGMNT